MKAMLISLAAATAVAAAVVWAPAPGGWFGADAPAGDDPPPAPAAPAEVIAPAGIHGSAAAAQVQFAAATALDPSQASAAAPPKPPPGPPILVGLTDGAPRRFAYVLEDGQTTRAGLWDKVGKWRVTAIGPHGVTLSAGRQTLALALYGPRPMPPPPIAAADVAPTPPPVAPPPPQAPPRARALEPASAPSPPATGGHHAHYWVGPANLAPPGYIALKPGQLPPQP
ncbi:MAG TPA: hypothetical protein VHW60_16120 [Caulobacteraceae bacterium]|jgi:hypothetical protein|nr:hypothetical protein [Caulobacteraceae bacterium]